MVNHMPVRLEITKEYTAGQKSPSNRKEVYAAMIIYGLLSYHDGELRIPNKELMLEFESALEDSDFDYVAEPDQRKRILSEIEKGRCENSPRRWDQL